MLSVRFRIVTIVASQRSLTLVSPLRRFGLAAAILTLVPAISLGAQTLPSWHAIVDRTITADDANLSAVGQLLLLPSGELAVVQNQEDEVRFIGPRADSVSATFGHQGEGPGEFHALRWIGTQRGQFWIEDVQLKRLTFMSAAHKLAKTLREPTSVSMPGHGATNFAIVFIQGVTPDGGLIAEALRGVNQPRPSWATETEWQGDPFLNVDTAGMIRSIVAWVPKDPCLTTVTSSRGVSQFATPFCSGNLVAIASDGTTIAIVVMDQVAHSYRVSSMKTNGDTAFSKHLSYAPQPIATARFDSVMKQRRESMAKRGTTWPSMKQPDGYPPFDRLVVGRDGTVWLGEYRTGTTRSWQVLDGTGKSIGTVQLPGNVDVQVADRSQIWGVARDADGNESLDHYTLAAR
ncbi:MAG: hypothetical protein ACREL5_12150 [Gemmatimonadales bacterium]